MADHLCNWWFAYTFDHPGRRLFQKPEKILAPYIRQGMTVLDLGCGMGFFAMAAARLVGSKGKVVAADLQPKMLDVMIKRAHQKGLADRIRPQQCRIDDIAVDEPVDFAYGIWMAHEVIDLHVFAGQIAGQLPIGGRFLLIEPKFHVSKNKINQEVQFFTESGFVEIDRPKVGLSHAVLLEKRD